MLRNVLRIVLRSLVSCSLVLSIAGRPLQVPVQFEPPKDWERLPVMPHEFHHAGRWISSSASTQAYAYGESNVTEQIYLVLDVLTFHRQRAAGTTDTRYARYLDLLATELPHVRWSEGSASAEGDWQVSSVYGVLFPDSAGAPRRLLVARTCRNGDLEVAFQVRCVPKERDAAEAVVNACARSAKLLPNGKVGPLLAPPRPLALLRELHELESSAAARLAKDQATALLSWAKSSTVPGWKLGSERNIHLLSEGSSASAKEIAKDMACVHEWLESAFGPYVRSKTPRPVLISVYPSVGFENSRRDDIAEHDARRTVQPYRASIVTFDGKNSISNYDHMLAGQGLIAAWFEDRDPDLRAVLPEWIEIGLPILASTVRAKGGCSGEPLQWEASGIQSVENKDRILSARSILTEAYPPVSRESSAAMQESTCHASQLLRSLCGPGKKLHRQAEAAWTGLLEALSEQVRTARPALEEQLAKFAPSTLAPEIEIARERNRLWSVRKSELQRIAISQAFAGWTDKEWNELEQVHRAAY